jgi:chorismate lyase/3-hydroxybenzoate synthase
MNSESDKNLPIGFAYLEPEAYRASQGPFQRHPLAAILHGNCDPPEQPWPQVSSGLQPLGGPGAVELLHSATQPYFSNDDGFHLAVTEEFLFGACSLPATAEASLSALAEDIYGRLFQIVEDKGYPYLQRVWNVVPSINRTQSGMERYKQFCLGRHAAFGKHLPNMERSYPSASAVGSSAGMLCVYFLAARTPGVPIENPRQVSAYKYPPQYGPKSPSFSRALVRKWQDSACLFLSGTASITGHETRHLGHLSAQAEETLDNIRTLVATASVASGAQFSLDPATSLLKVYIRKTSDYQEVCDLLHQQLGGSIDVLYLKADLCRKELLLELDGVVFAPQLAA